MILDTLPPEGRFFIEGTGGGTLIIRGISSELACGKLGGAGSNELDVYVEDDVAEAILRSILAMAIRERINIHPIGSVEAALRLLSSKYLEIQDDSIIILDETEISEKIMPSQSVA